MTLPLPLARRHKRFNNTVTSAPSPRGSAMQIWLVTRFASSWRNPAPPDPYGAVGIAERRGVMLPVSFCFLLSVNAAAVVVVADADVAAVAFCCCCCCCC